MKNACEIMDFLLDVNQKFGTKFSILFAFHLRICQG